MKDVLDPRIKEEVEKVASSVSYAIVRQKLHSGPMPSPQQLAEYEQVLPGLAAEIRNEFLANGNHVRPNPTVVDQQAAHYSSRGRRFNFHTDTAAEIKKETNRPAQAATTKLPRKIQNITVSNKPNDNGLAPRAEMIFPSFDNTPFTFLS